MKSPSKWHDSAIERDAGHDDMQAFVLRKFAEGETVPLWGDWTGKVEYSQAEFPFTDKGILRGFADIAVRLRDPHDETLGSLWLFLELKPRIGSVGAVIRQCRATELLAKRHFSDPQKRPAFHVMPVVYVDDPKFQLLREMWDDKLFGFERQ